MATSRYSFINKLSISNKIIYATTNHSFRINKAINSGILSFNTYILKEGERIDQVAFKFYGDSQYWWIIAAASGIGWGLQIPPGTILRVPESLNTALGISRWILTAFIILILI